MPAGSNSLILTTSPQYKDNKQSKIQFAEIMRVREQSTVVPKMVQTATIAPGNWTIRYPLIGKLAAGPIEEGREIAGPVDFPAFYRELVSDSYGVLSFRSDKVQRQTATHSISDELNRRQGEAMARLEEEELVALFDTFTTKFDLSGSSYTTGANNKVTLSTATNAMKRPAGVNPQTFAFGSLEAMRDRDPNIGPAPLGSKPFAILSPNAAFMLVENVLSKAGFDASKGIGGPSTGGGGSMYTPGNVAIPHGLSEDLVRSYHLYDVAGVSVYQTPNIKIFDNSAGTAIATYDSKTGEAITASGANQYDSVSEGNSASHGALMVRDAMIMVREQAFHVDAERSVRLRGDWYVATQDFKPYVMYDPWGIFLYAQSPTFSYTAPTLPKGWT